MTDDSSITVPRAIQDFHSARQKASLREIIARITGDNTELLSFDEVRQKLRAQILPKQVLKEIPLASIIGSVNRYQDFTRDFLPSKNINEQRWAKIELASYGSMGLPPIEVYQIGEVYFVSDGNHRVSVAKQLGATQIQAYVTEVRSRVSLSPSDQPDDLILKSEFTDFLEHTDLDKVRPEADVSVTVPGQYAVLEEHIAVHRYFMGIDLQRDISLSEAAADWYDKVYLPVISVIRERGLLLDFPGRTEADLYLWIADHRAALEEELQNQVEVTAAVEDLADQYSQRPYRVVARIGSRIVKTLMPAYLETGPYPGEWRQTIVSRRLSDKLFPEILVPINGQADGWFALDQAFIVARRERTGVHGLYIQEGTGEADLQATTELQEEFTTRCSLAGIPGEVQFKAGDITENICSRAVWNDLVVMNLSYPPASSMFARLSSGTRNLVQRCPRPILFTPQVCKPFDKALLAYDGSLKAQEALFIASYTASSWHMPLAVISIGTEADIRDILDDARKYLEGNQVQAEYILAAGGNTAVTLLQYVDQLGVDLLIIGGYSRMPILEVLEGGDVDELLRLTHIPVIICR